jgi:hydroxymethylpyrimidine/phosphomethylpyrimidine kinase
VTTPRILVIAGSDSGGGAGIQADIKTITMLGGHAMTAITAITAQNTLGIIEVMAVPPAMVLAQIDAVASDLGIDAVKIGMIGSADIAGAVAERLGRLRPIPIVFDPVMVATSGTALADPAAIAAFARLMALATLVTPNVPELEALTGLGVADEAAMADAAQKLATRFGCQVLAKGGHLPGEKLVDLLVSPDGVSARWPDSRIETRHTHGTGCTLASGVATGLGAGLSLKDAIDRSRRYVRAALRHAPGFGGGHGPIGHGLGGAAF